VALDRQRIERKDFPIGRRGYDPDAVDAHLAALADELDEFKRSSRRRSESLASAASEQVRSIVEAAETSASEIQRQAEDEARDIRAEASTEAQTTREQATTQAREYVGNVSESTATMLERLDAMQNELGALFDALRTGSNRLGADLQLVERNLEEVRDAVAPRPRFEPEQPAQASRAPQPAVPTPPAPPATPAPQAATPAAEAGNAGSPAVTPSAAPGSSVEPPAEVAFPPAVPESPGGGQPDLPELEPDQGPRPHGDALGQATPVAVGSAGGAATEDSESARLVALNMAMDRKPREETERYLAENFRLSDLRGLVDDVYSSFEV
jgi:DivIVA domain-containing protein